MNDKLDPLEAELAAMQPRQPSPALARKIAAELAGTASRRRYAVLGALACAVAASVLAALWLWPSSETVRVETSSPIQPALTVAFDPTLPSVWSFRAATVQAGDDLNAVLDQHSATAPPEPANYVQIRGFGVSETNRQSILGEL